MSDDFGTLNVKGGDRTREIEGLRQHYRRHRDALERMISDAPTELLAGEYRRLAEEIERSVAKLDAGEGRKPEPPPISVDVPAVAQREDASRPAGDPSRAAIVEPGMRTLHPTPHIGSDDTRPYPPPSDDADGGGSRILMILGAAIVAIGLIGWLIWRAAGRQEEAPLVDTVPAVATESSEPVIEAVTAPEVLAIFPASQNYGAIRKGTRATRRFQITNKTGVALSIQLARSACRCLYYDYTELIPPGAKESVVVTIDGAKAPLGMLRESIAITSKTNPDARGTLEVAAEVR